MAMRFNQAGRAQAPDYMQAVIEEAKFKQMEENARQLRRQQDMEALGGATKGAYDMELHKLFSEGGTDQTVQPPSGVGGAGILEAGSAAGNAALNTPQFAGAGANLAGQSAALTGADMLAGATAAPAMSAAAPAATGLASGGAATAAPAAATVAPAAASTAPAAGGLGAMGPYGWAALAAMAMASYMMS